MTKKRARKPKKKAAPIGVDVRQLQAWSEPVSPAPLHTVGDASAMYVKLPLPPELLAAAQKYVEMGRELASVFVDANATARVFLGALERAASEVERDVARLKKRRRR